MRKALTAVLALFTSSTTSNIIAAIALAISVVSVVVSYRAGARAEYLGRYSEGRRQLDAAVQELGGPNPAVEAYVPRSAEGLEAARRAIELAQVLVPNEPEVLIYAALIAALRGDIERAENLRLRALELAPRQSRLTTLSADIMWRTHRQADALKEYEKATTAPDAGSDAFHAYGVALDRMGKKVQAIEWYGRALEINKYSAPTYSALAGLLLEMHRFDDGVATCNRAISEARIEDARLLVACSQLNLHTAELERANEFASRCVELHPEFAYAWAAKGEVLKAQGNLNAAVAAFRRAASLDPLNRQFAQMERDARIRLGK